VDIKLEQALLTAHDIIFLQHPHFLYSVLPLSKQWIDLVLTLGWAFGSGGMALQEKYWFHALSSCGPEVS
jgi:glutathione-regulated potassium-efflux system ancillary protein KefG